MKTFIKPFWWIPVFLIPQLLLFIYEFSVYSIIKTEQPDDVEWAWLAGLQLTIFSLSFLYIGFVFLQKRTVPWWYPFFTLIIQIPMLIWFISHEHDFIPQSVPGWMVDREELFLLYIACTMPTLFFAVLQLVSYTIKEESKRQLPVSIVFTLLIPLCWYLCFTLIVPALYQSENYDQRAMIETTFMILAIVSFVVFFFFLIRTLLLLGQTMVKKPVVRIVIVVICCLIAPLAGLWINNEGDTWGSNLGGSNIFGDFSHWSFYLLTVLNATLLLIPTVPQKSLERILVALRFFTLPFSLYFLIVFIPFLPLSVAAMIFVGVGILLLAPVLNFIIHVSRLFRDLENNTIFPTRSSRWLIALPVLLLPLILHFNFLFDRYDLQKALAWVYTPNYSEKETTADPKRISYVLDVVASNGRNRGMFQGKKYWKPYLSSYYRWLVLDNMTLSGRKIADLERIFVGTNYYNTAETENAGPTPEVIVRSMETETQLDKSGTFYKTMVHLELENSSPQQQEFVSAFLLPEGAWVSDYYLDIGTKREHGILAEKRTAQWVYRNIVNRRKDPGIISYLNGNELELRVFPLEAGEKRRTGIEIVHKGSLSFPFAGGLVSVQKPMLKVSGGTSVEMITAAQKRDLKALIRKKKYYLLIDNSLAVSNPAEKNKLLNRVQDEVKILLASGVPMELYSVHHSAQALNLKAWRPLAEKRIPEGGFFVDRLMKSILVDHYQRYSNLAPIFIVYSPHVVTIPKDFMDLSFTFPDVDRYFVSGSERAYANFYNARAKEIPDDSSDGASAAQKALTYMPSEVCLWGVPTSKKYFLPVSGNSIVLTHENYTELNKAHPLWKKAATQQGNTRFLRLHPEVSEEYWRKLVAQNFETGIMSPYSSYLVVETEAQKEVLRQKQKEVLNAAQYFDIEQGFISMAEPAWWWYLLIGLVFILLKKNGVKVQVRN